MSFKESYRTVLTQVHPDNQLGSNSIVLLDEICQKIIHVMTVNAKEVMIKDHKRRILKDHIRQSISNILIDELQKHALIEGEKGMRNVSQFIFPINKTARYMRIVFNIDEDSVKYMSYVIEYLFAEIIELSGSVCKDMIKIRISPDHIKLAINNDTELYDLVIDKCKMKL
jgi:hypothetical protein